MRRHGLTDSGNRDTTFWISNFIHPSDELLADKSHRNQDNKLQKILTWEKPKGELS